MWFDTALSKEPGGGNIESANIVTTALPFHPYAISSSLCHSPPTRVFWFDLNFYPARHAVHDKKHRRTAHKTSAPELVSIPISHQSNAVGLFLFHFNPHSSSHDVRSRNPDRSKAARSTSCHQPKPAAHSCWSERISLPQGRGLKDSESAGIHPLESCAEVSGLGAGPIYASACRLRMCSCDGGLWDLLYQDCINGPKTDHRHPRRYKQCSAFRF